MSGFLYFVPTDRDELIKSDKLDHAVLAQYGLGAVLSDVHRVPDDCIAIGVQRGPEGRTGVLLAPVTGSGQVPDVSGYYPDSQEWQARGDGAFIGWCQAIVPGDLMRKRLYLGYFVIADDGQSWLIPIARSTDESRITLPAFIQFNGSKPVRKIKKRFEGLWNIAGEYLQRLAGKESLADSEQWRIEAAAEALGVNYRVGYPELNVLAELEQSPLDTQMVEVILKSLVDEQIVLDAKKNVTQESSQPPQNGSDTGPGSEASSPVTLQVGES